MQLTLQAMDETATGTTVEVSDSVFGRPFNESLVHQVVTSWLAGSRHGSRAQKSRSEVAGGGAKPWRQKGTGRARAGTIRSPVWRGGGMAFPAKPKSYAQKVNRKMYRGALRAIVGELVRQERLLIIESLALAAPKTKELLGKLQVLGLKDVLIVTEGEDVRLALAARNVPDIEVRTIDELNPVSMIGHDKVLVTLPALKQLEERLS